MGPGLARKRQRIDSRVLACKRCLVVFREVPVFLVERAELLFAFTTSTVVGKLPLLNHNVGDVLARIGALVHGVIVNDRVVVAGVSVTSVAVYPDMVAVQGVVARLPLLLVTENFCDLREIALHDRQICELSINDLCNLVERACELVSGAAWGHGSG